MAEKEFYPRLCENEIKGEILSSGPRQMYFTKTRFTISCSHRLALDYESKCTKIHGHNWLITVHCKSEKLDSCGMVMDFSTVKHMIKERLDHSHLNDTFPQPTAEYIARWICERLTPFCYRVDIEESPGNEASYERYDV